MANRVRAQQAALKETNDRLERANDGLENANNQLAFSNQDLEVKIRQRTDQLEQANARLSMEIAEKDDFLRTVSHDLNAPLRNIAGMASMLLMKHRESFDEDVIHRLERIQKNVEVETSLIGELLELSRIKTRRQKMENVDLVELASEVGTSQARIWTAVRFRLHVDPNLPTLHCEKSRLRQLLQNLVDNAIKYMGAGSDPAALGQAGVAFSPVSAGELVREIQVGCRKTADDVELFVRDTGIGIDTADLQNVFRVFRRGKSQAVQAVAGKGVGLASVKSIVESYGGTIAVESKVGVGSTFRFTVDRKYVADQSPNQGKPTPSGQRAA